MLDGSNNHTVDIYCQSDSPTVCGNPIDQFNRIQENSSTVNDTSIREAVNSRILGKFPALAISSETSKMAHTVICIFDWSEQIQTSWIMIVTNVPLANSCQTWISNDHSSETGSSITDKILSFCALVDSEQLIIV